MKLTDIAIRHAKPVKKPLRLFDGSGLYLEVSPSGGKWWRLKYRYGGKEKRLSLGVYPDTGLREARDRCVEARKLLAAQVDPAEARRAHKASRTEAGAQSFEAIAREWYAKQQPTWADSRTAIPGAGTGRPRSPRAREAGLLEEEIERAAQSRRRRHQDHAGQSRWRNLSLPLIGDALTR